MLAGTFDHWLEREWLLTNGRGGFASSTLIGCPTRREHGWMVWNVPGPRLERWMLWSHAAENLHVDGRASLLANFEFNSAVDPHGYRHLTAVEAHFDDPAPRIVWTYRTETAAVRRTLIVVDDSDVVVVRYHVAARPTADIRLQVWPMIAARPIGALRRRTAGELFQMSQDGGAIGLLHRLDPRIMLSLLGRRGDGGAAVEFNPRGDWWYNFRYRREAERGLECGEDLMVPGAFIATGKGTLEVELVGIGGVADPREAWRVVRQLSLPEPAGVAPGAVVVRFDSPGAGSGDELSQTMQPVDRPDVLLRRAARQFIFRQRSAAGPGQIGVAAGYPWLTEYSRDACVSLPGLLLATGRHDEAREMLLRMALLRRDGGLPVHLIDDAPPHEYVSADSGLWFVHAVDAYLRETNDRGPAARDLLAACLDIVQALASDRHKGVHFEDDGLLVCEDPAAAATWMDARYSWVFQTPRVGRAVEINALWYHALCVVADRLAETAPAGAEECRVWANRVRAVFAPTFWNGDSNGLYDVVGDSGPDASIRPNQLFAICLRHSPLSDAQQAAVVKLVTDRLLTPMGLRSLSPDAPNYHGEYTGNVESRERAAHQGSVYAWLMGPYVEAYLRVHGGSDRARAECRALLQPLLAHLTGAAGLLGVSEVFDGDAPHHPRGGITQGWCVAELLRAWALTASREEAAALRAVSAATALGGA
ncbi:MAG: amylo-alpha-1,6-glucosidase [Phycisphaerae bacterium]